MFYKLNNQPCYSAFDSSVGRAVNCSMLIDIHKSLVRLRLEGLFLYVIKGHRGIKGKLLYI